MRDADVIVVGAGVAGLACAVTLKQAGCSVLVLEAADAVGGRVRSDVCDGFVLDRGFQVLLDAYPTCRRLLDQNALHLCAFEPGASIRLASGTCTVSDPFRRPASALATLLAPVGGLADKLRISRLRKELLEMDPAAVWGLPNRSTADFLKDFGFGSRIIESFFRPFLAGVFLERDLATSARMFAFVYRCFSAGSAVLPAGGMSAIPIQLEARLGSASIRTDTRVERVEAGIVRVADGPTLTARSVVVATDGDQAALWFPELHRRPWNGQTCYYFDAPESPFAGQKRLWLNATGRGRVNHIAVPSDIAPGYAPPGRALVSVNTVGDAGAPARPEAVAAELAALLGPRAHGWRFLRAYPITRALPRLEPADLAAAAAQPRRIRGVHLCGDFLFAGSLDGAMASGVEAAHSVLGE